MRRQEHRGKDGDDEADRMPAGHGERGHSASVPEKS
jgi:hypothetical protein